MACRGPQCYPSPISINKRKSCDQEDMTASRKVTYGILPTLRALAELECDDEETICFVPCDMNLDPARHLQMILLEAYCREIGVEVSRVSHNILRNHYPLAKYLKNSNISSMEDLKILSVTPTSEVTFHFFGNSDDGDKIRESLNRLVQRRRLNEVSLESTHFTFQQKPALKLQSLRINQVNEREVRLGNEFVLSCTAHGSYNINFTWYKDNMLINMSKATREIWYRHLPNDGSDTHTSLLTIEKAAILDGGQYTCKVSDWGFEQCKSIYIEIKDDPEVKIVPMSATIEKGQSIQLTCTTPNLHSTGIGFGWTKNRALLKLKPGTEVWEDLYPAGSILKITNLQKSVIYTCNVAHKSMSVRVEVVNKTRIPLCPKGESWGIQWSDTAPGSESLLECPKFFIGHRVSKLCSMKDATTPEWQIPDFSACLYKPFLVPYNNFRNLKFGYQNTTGSETIQAFWEILKSRKISLYPGEGDRILNLLAEIERYQYHFDMNDLYNSNEALTQIANRILSEKDSILNPQKLLVLLQLNQRNLVHWSKKLNNSCKHLSLSSMVVDIQQLQKRDEDSVTHSLQIPMEKHTYPNWFTDKIAIRLWKQKHRSGKANNTLNGIIVAYKNLSTFLPTSYVKELNDGTDLVYRMNSRVITVMVPSFGPDKHNKVWVDLQLKHSHNVIGSWNISCGLMDKVGSWDFDSCIANTLSNDPVTHCFCPNTGTIAVFSTTRAMKVVLAKKEQSTSIVILGCSSCLVQCLMTSFIVGIFWWYNRTWLNFLKLQCCCALIGAMSIFIYAVHTNLSDEFYSIFAISLEAFLLVGLSAPISQVLIIYAKLTNIQPNRHFQPTVIAVITGVPILAILTTELTHKTTGWRHESWWLIYGSGVYKIFVTCATMMLLLFILLYMGVIYKAHTLVQENVLKKETIRARLRMLHCAAIIVCCIIAMEVSSILYINSNSITFHYVFATVSSILGFCIMMVYGIFGEITNRDSILRKFKWKSDTGDVRTSEPVKVYSKSCGEVENDAAPPQSLSISSDTYLEVRGIAAGSIDMRELIAESSGSYVKKSVPPSSRYLPEIRIDHSGDINLENYNTSPKKYQESKSFDSSSYTQQEQQDPLKMESSSPKVLCNVDVESRLLPDVTLAVKTDKTVVEFLTSGDLKKSNAIPDIANTTERKQPDGEEETPETKIITDCESSASSGMLDRISHDLDYLLNRTHDG